MARYLKSIACNKQLILNILEVELINLSSPLFGGLREANVGQICRIPTMKKIMLHKYCSRNVELCIIIYIISLIEGIILYILEIVHHGFIYPQFGGEKQMVQQANLQNPGNEKNQCSINIAQETCNLRSLFKLLHELKN